MKLLRERSEIELNLTNVVLLATARAGTIEMPEVRKLQGWLHPPLEISQLGGQGWTVSSMRDQIEVVVLGSRVEIKDHSGNRDFSKLSKAVATALKLTGVRSRAYGINFEISLPVEYGDSPGLFVAQNLLDYGRVSKVAPVRYAAVELRFALDDREIGLVFQPRRRPEDPVDLVLSANAHHDVDIRDLSASGTALDVALRTKIGTTLEQVLDLVESL